MTAEVWQYLIAALAGALVGGGVKYLVAKLTYKSSKEANDISSLREAASEWRSLKDDYRAELDVRKAEVAKLREDLTQLRHEVEVARVAHEVEMQELRKRHEVERQEDAAWRQVAVNYVDTLREHILRELPPPPPTPPSGWPSKEEGT